MMMLLSNRLLVSFGFSPVLASLPLHQWGFAREGVQAGRKRIGHTIKGKKTQKGEKSKQNKADDCWTWKFWFCSSVVGHVVVPGVVVQVCALCGPQGVRAGLSGGGRTQGARQGSPRRKLAGGQGERKGTGRAGWSRDREPRTPDRMRGAFS